MHRPNTNPDNVQQSDVLCDFCHRQWTDDLPVIEGHQGSIICGHCLSLAYRLVMLEKSGNAPEGYKCVMCLEHRVGRASSPAAQPSADHAPANQSPPASEPGWQSPAYPEAIICKRCTNQAAATLSKDKDYNWQKPQ